MVRQHEPPSELSTVAPHYLEVERQYMKIDGLLYTNGKGWPIPEPRKAWISSTEVEEIRKQKPYEQTRQLIKNKDHEFWEPVNLLKAHVVSLNSPSCY